MEQVKGEGQASGPLGDRPRPGRGRRAGRAPDRGGGLGPAKQRVRRGREGRGRPTGGR